MGVLFRHCNSLYHSLCARETGVVSKGSFAVAFVIGAEMRWDTTIQREEFIKEITLVLSS